MPTVQTEVRNNVGVITLNRPATFNSFDRDMALGLQAALDNHENNKSVRCIYLTAKGKAFSAGQDIKYLLSPEAVHFSRLVKEHYNPIVKGIFEMSKIVVCGVNGVAAGAGANIALSCDITVARESASFIQAFSKIGLIPDSGGTYMLSRLIGFQRAKAYALMGDKISANEAERVGMIYKSFADDIFEEEAFNIAEKLSKMPTLALEQTKKLYRESLNNTFQEQIELEANVQTQLAESEDYKEGIQAFVEKRKPSYKGK